MRAERTVQRSARPADPWGQLAAALTSFSTSAFSAKIQSSSGAST